MVEESIANGGERSTNLLSNAIKYAPERSTVRVALISGPRDSDQRIAISDQGPGIDPAEAERIFEHWHPAPDTTAPGLGLGLYIVERIVDLHGGRVVLEGTPGQGSTFIVVLPR
jgi:signal transduction histidine kinase